MIWQALQQANLWVGRRASRVWAQSALRRTPPLRAERLARLCLAAICLTALLACPVGVESAQAQTLHDPPPMPQGSLRDRQRILEVRRQAADQRTVSELEQREQQPADPPETNPQSTLLGESLGDGELVFTAEELDRLNTDFGPAPGALHEIPNMFGDNFFGHGCATLDAGMGASFSSTVTAVYANAAVTFNAIDSSFTFFHPGGGSAGLPSIITGVNTPPFVAGTDDSGDAIVDTLEVVDVPAGLADVVAASQGISGTIVFVEAFGRQTSSTPSATQDTAIVGAPIGAADGIGGAIDVQYVYTFTPDTLNVKIPSPSSGNGVAGRIKIAENNTPIPRDRFISVYSYSDNVPIITGGAFVNRFTLGGEKTFWDGLASFEIRAPIAFTLNSNISLPAAGNRFDQFEWGNLSLALKGILISRETFVLTSGVQMTFPTAGDVLVSLPSGTELVRVNNQSVHVMPFVGAAYAPTDKFFMQGFFQLDFDVNGNAVDMNNGTDLVRVGRANDSTFAYLDLAIGYWLKRGEDLGFGITGIAPTAELHWSHSLRSADVFSNGTFSIHNAGDNVDVLNLVMGTHFQFGENTHFGLGWTQSLLSASGEQFDHEIRMFLNQRY